MELTGRKKHSRWIWMYTVMFLCGAGTLAAIAKYYGRTLIWNPDGFKQHYSVIAYVGQMLRRLLSGEGYQMLSFSLGQGMDVLTACSYCGYTDPISLLGIFGHGHSVEYVYMAMDFLRMYLAGMAFGLYARTIEIRDDWAIACGGIIYVFGGYFIYMAGRHPYFLNGALYLALLLSGIERVFKSRKWLMYTLITALMLMVNFYLGFKNTVIAVIYIIVRLIARMKEKGIRESVKDGFMLLGGYLLGAALSMVIFLPVAMTYLGNGRMGEATGYTASMLTYGAKYNWDNLMYMFAPWRTAGEFLLTNYAPAALFGLMGLWCARGRRARQMRVALYLCVIAMLVPAFGYVINGMAYVSQRWSYAVGFFVALGFIEGFPALMEAEGMRRRKIIALIAMVYGCVLTVNAALGKDWPQLIAPAFIAVFAAVIMVYDRGWLSPKRLKRLTAAFLTVTVMSYIMVGYTPYGYGYIENQQKEGVYKRAGDQAVAQLIDDEGVYRVAQGNYDDNHSLMLDYMGTSFFWSMVDGGISNYYAGLGLPSQLSAYKVQGLGASAAMNAVAGVKYYVRREGKTETLPYGYDKSQTLTLSGGKTADVFENEYALPLGYAYEAVMPEEEYKALSVWEKYQALLSYAICDRESPEDDTAFADDAIEVAYAFGESAKVEMADNAMNARKNGFVEIGFDAPDDCELYLIVEGLRLSDRGAMKEGGLVVESGWGTTPTTIPSPRSNFYFPRECYAFCLGSGEETVDSCVIRFKNKMNYSYDRIRVVAIPLTRYREDVQARRSEAMEDIELSNNRISGTITVGGDRILQIAVPYSAGWYAWVDGEEAEVFRCGGMYMGIELEEGAHNIEMRYVTPGLKAGGLISLLAAAITVALASMGMIRRRKERRI